MGLSRKAFVCGASIAQLAEQRTLNPQVAGSTPAGGTKLNQKQKAFFLKRFLFFKLLHYPPTQPLNPKQQDPHSLGVTQGLRLLHPEVA